MPILKSALVRALLAPILLALVLAACAAGTVARHEQPFGVTAPALTGSDGAVVDAEALAVKKYKMSTVRKHNKKSNCWTVIDRNVYKLTSFVKKHPGGARRIVAICGKNGTAAFRGQHGTGGKANRVLKKYKIGVLA
jgi:cytochrome b involved in lipid metabolism